MKIINPAFYRLLLCALLILVNCPSNAAMYKYITKDGSTLLTAKPLKGSGNKLVKIYKIKTSGAYKSSITKSKKTIPNEVKTKKKSSRKNNKRKFSNQLKRIGKKFTNLVKANGRDNGIIVGCGNTKHLRKKTLIYQKTIQIYSRIYDVDEELIHAIVRQESCFNEGAHSRVGAIGLMQLMPQTALGLRIYDPWNPELNIQGGIKYIAEMLERFDGNYKFAIAAYNAGPGNVNKYNGIPPFNETRKYVTKVYAEYQRLKKNGISFSKKIQLAAN